MKPTIFFSLESATNIKSALALVGIWTAASLLLSLPRITHPAFGIQGDLSLHYHITRSFARSVDEGDLLPRWAGLLDGGNGDALFTFYPPLSYLFCAAVMKLPRVDVLAAMRVVSWLILLLAQISAYHFARAFFRRGRSLIVSLFYVGLPAFPLIALNRGFFANAVALALAPVSLLGAHRLLSGERPARGFALFAIGTSGVILSHVITTYLCGVAIGLMLLIYLPRTGWRGPARLLAASLAVFALTAFFLVPQQVEMKWVQVGLQLARQDYRNYFLFAKPPDDSHYRQTWAGVNDVISYLTLAQVALAFLFGLACWPLLRNRRPPAPPIVLGLTLAAFGLAISLPWSDVLWRYLPGLKFIQFPWRFLPFVSLGCGLLAAVMREGWSLLKPFPRAAISFLMTVLVVANILFTWAVARLHDPEITSDRAAKLLQSPDLKKVSFEEANRIQNDDKVSYLGYSANQIFFRPNQAELAMYPPVSEPGGLTIFGGRGHITSQQISIKHRRFTVECNEPVRARLETYHYPHWVARLDGREIPVGVEREQGRGEGLMLLDLPAGRYELTLDFEVRTPVERWAAWLSVCAWVLLIGWMIRLMILRLIARFRRQRATPV
ncbi:MAG: 6-pyruvoyl-tetrahydropterin synthase-related protein [Blastocatellia bacterium]